MITAARVLYTAADLFALGQGFELVRGRILPKPFGTGPRGTLAAYFALLLAYHCERTWAGHMFIARGIVLARSPDTVRVPDVAFYTPDRSLEADEAFGFLRTAPDLVADVAPLHWAEAQLSDVVEQWLHAGTRLVWIARPERAEVVEARAGLGTVVRHAGERLDGHGLLPGFRCAVSELR